MADLERPGRSWSEHGARDGGVPAGDGAVQPPWEGLQRLRPLTLRSCRRIVVVAPHPRDEIRAAGGLLRRLAAAHASVDVLCLTDLPTRTCTPPDGLPVRPIADEPGRVVDLPGRDGAADPAVLDALDLPDPDEPEDGGPDPDDLDDPAEQERAAADAYRTLGLGAVRRHRLGLPDGVVTAHEPDVVAAISELVGFADEGPSGLCLLAPWSGDGDDDHEGAGRAAEVITSAYRVRLVRWLDRAWTWAGPDSAEVPWRRARQVALSASVLARKLKAGAAFGDHPGHDRELPDGSAPGPREVFLV